MSNQALKHNCVEIVPIFNHLPKETMEQIRQKAKTKTYNRGDFLYHAGEENQIVYIINKGQVRVYRLSEQGKEQVVRILNPGDFVGEFAILEENKIHETYAEVMRSASVCTFSRQSLLEIIDANPGISMKIMSELASRLAESERQTSHVTASSVRDRIIYYLESNVDPEAGDNPIVDLAMPRKDLASYLGTTPESLSRKFAELESENLIKQLPKGKIEINNLDLLVLSTDE